MTNETLCKEADIFAELCKTIFRALRKEHWKRLDIAFSTKNQGGINAPQVIIEWNTDRSDFEEQITSTKDGEMRGN